ncbi:major facilitator superfamily domain-containing protein [Xylariomycetidae sp. FL2044]|nr:major facilitator superfamily domain-containing protein [Xylariomycetidae sp. FL2044]
MTLEPQHADDSCPVNQTVPAAASPCPPEQNDEHYYHQDHHDDDASLPNADLGNLGSSWRAHTSQPGESSSAPTTTTTTTTTARNPSNRSLSGGGRGCSEDDDIEASPSTVSVDYEEQDEEPDTYPEGGLQAWLVVLGSFCAMISVYGIINSAAVFESYFATHQLARYGSSTIGWIFSSYLFIVFFVGVQVGPIFDRYGPRVLVAVGSLLLVASQLLLGLCKEYYQILLTYSILGGLGGALLNVPAYGVIAHFFRERRALATGVAATAGSIGGIVIPLYLQAVLPRIGFAWSTRCIGLAVLLLSVVANLLMRSRLPPRKRDAAGRRASIWPDWTLFRDLKFSLCCAGLWFMEWGIFIPLIFIVSYASAHGQDATAAYALLAFLNVGSFFGRFLPGFLADRLGRFNVIVATNALCAVTFLALWLPDATRGGDSDGDGSSSRPLLLAFAVLFGFASGSNLGLFPVCIGQLCDAREYGRFYSTALMLGSFGTLTSVPIGGALLGLGSGEQGWQALIIFSALSYVIATSCFAAARVVAVSWRVKRVF